MKSIYAPRGKSTVEAITFDELIVHGRKNGAVILNKLPLFWYYNKQLITRKDDNCYIIHTSRGKMEMQRGDMLIIKFNGFSGEVFPWKRDALYSNYKLIE